MKIISGCVIKKNNKILMVQEAQKKCYGQWNFPAGHVDDGEKITEAALREVYEETGCKVKLTGVLPICSKEDKEPRIMVRFTADIIKEDIKFDKKEILDVQWIDIEKIKCMTEQELRAYDVNMSYIKWLEEERIYPIEIFDNSIK